MAKPTLPLSSGPSTLPGQSFPIYGIGPVTRQCTSLQGIQTISSHRASRARDACHFHVRLDAYQRKVAVLLSSAFTTPGKASEDRLGSCLPRVVTIPSTTQSCNEGSISATPHPIHWGKSVDVSHDFWMLTLSVFIFIFIFFPSASCCVLDP